MYGGHVCRSQAGDGDGPGPAGHIIRSGLPVDILTRRID